jgi:hypothetical protein
LLILGWALDFPVWEVVVDDGQSVEREAASAVTVVGSGAGVTLSI